MDAVLQPRNEAFVVKKKKRKVVSKKDNQKLMVLSVDDNGTATQSITQNGFRMIQIPEGTTSGQRIGNRIWLESLQFNLSLKTEGSFVASATTGVPSSYWRSLTPTTVSVFVVRNKQPNGQLIGFTNIYEINDNEFCTALREYRAREKFDILKVEHITMSYNSGGLTSEVNSGVTTHTGVCLKNVQYLKFHCPLKFYVDFAGSTIDPSNVRTNELLFYIAIEDSSDFDIHYHVKYRIYYRGFE